MKKNIYEIFKLKSNRKATYVNFRYLDYGIITNFQKIVSTCSHIAMDGHASISQLIIREIFEILKLKSNRIATYVNFRYLDCIIMKDFQKILSMCGPYLDTHFWK